ncbi:MAG: hypothetical protein SWH68_15365 [Thermodesulfobacteriota bacterium]|nr:hypothetical protein [Thermodesulfobacteriota bacterium]
MKESAEAASLFSDRLKLLVMGRGDQSRFSALAERAGIQEKVIFAGPVQDVSPYYLASDFKYPIK